MTVTAKTQSNTSQLLDQSYDKSYKYALKDTNTLNGVDKTIWLSLHSDTPFADNVDVVIVLGGVNIMAWQLLIKGLTDWSAPMQFDQIGSYTVTYSIAGATIATTTFSVAAKK